MEVELDLWCSRSNDPSVEAIFSGEDCLADVVDVDSHHVPVDVDEFMLADSSFNSHHLQTQQQQQQQPQQQQQQQQQQLSNLTLNQQLHETNQLDQLRAHCGSSAGNSSVSSLSPDANDPLGIGMIASTSASSLGLHQHQHIHQNSSNNNNNNNHHQQINHHQLHQQQQQQQQASKLDLTGGNQQLQHMMQTNHQQLHHNHLQPQQQPQLFQPHLNGYHEHQIGAQQQTFLATNFEQQQQQQVASNFEQQSQFAAPQTTVARSSSCSPNGDETSSSSTITPTCEDLNQMHHFQQQQHLFVAAPQPAFNQFGAATPQQQQQHQGDAPLVVAASRNDHCYILGDPGAPQPSPGSCSAPSQQPQLSQLRQVVAGGATATTTTSGADQSAGGSLLDQEQMQMLLESGPQPIGCSLGGESPLIAAIQSGQTPAAALSCGEQKAPRNRRPKSTSSGPQGAQKRARSSEDSKQQQQRARPGQQRQTGAKRCRKQQAAGQLSPTLSSVSSASSSGVSSVCSVSSSLAASPSSSPKRPSADSPQPPGQPQARRRLEAGGAQKGEPTTSKQEISTTSTADLASESTKRTEPERCESK